MSDLNVVHESFTPRGRRRYYEAGNPASLFEKREDRKKADYSFLSAENIFADILKKRKEKEEFNGRYALDFSDSEREALNIMLEGIEDSAAAEEKIYAFASALKYSKQFNLPFDFAYENLESINKQWLGAGKAPHKSNFKAITDSFIAGSHVFEMADLGGRLMSAEDSGDEREIQWALKDLKKAEDYAASLQDTLPRSWGVEVFKLAGNMIPYTAVNMAVAAASGPLAPAAGFVFSSSVASGLEYWELRKAGVKKDLARNLAVVSGSIQGLLETALGNVGSIALKNLNLKTVAEKVSAKLTASGKMGLVSKSFARYFLEGVEEGIEEGLQSYTSSGIKALASVLQEEGVETQSAWEASAEAWESFKGGLAGGLLLGIPGAVVDGRKQISEAAQVRKQAQINPSKEDFIKNTKDLSVFDGMSGEQKEEHLSNYYESQKKEREAAKKERIKDYEQILSEDARIEGEAVIDDEGNTVYERDEKGNIIYEENEGGEKSGKIKRYGEAEDVIRHGERLYITEGRKKEKANGDITGEYIAGNPTEETEYNDYAHIDYTYNKAKNTVRIDDVRIQHPKYQQIVKEFVRDFGEKFAGAEVKWNPASESFAKIKAELIAENPAGKAAGLQYFNGKGTQAEARAEIKLYERLKQTMPALNEQERRTAAAVFKALAHGAGMDSETYMNTYYAEDVLTNRPHSSLEYTAAQQDIEAKNIKGAVDFKQFESDIKALVYVSEKSDFSTFVHEAAHVARRTMSGELLLKAEKAFGVEGGKWTRAQEERFAKGFEQYLREGKAPSEELKTVFEKAAEFLSRIYKSLKEILHINDEIRAVYDELLSAKESPLKAAEKRSTQAEKTNKKAIKEFGRNYAEYYHKGFEAVEKVLKEQAGQVVGAFHRNDIGDIDVVWGNEKVGLQKIIDKHLNDFEPFGAGEKGVINGISEIVTNGTLTERNGVNTITYKKDSRSFRVGLTKGWDGKGENQWIITAYEENTGSGKGKTLSAVADFNSSQTPEKTAPDEHTVKDLQEKSKGYEETVKAAYEEAGAAARLAEEKKRYENEVIAWYKEHHSGADGEEIKELIKKEAARQRMSFEEYVKAVAKERQTLNGLDEQGAVFFQTEPVTEEEVRFKEAADAYREGVERFFDGKLKSSEVLTVTRRTPVILRAVGFEDKPITVTGASLKHITDKHKDITKEILKTLPEEFLNPVAVFKSQKEDKPNSRLIFTEHFVNGKPVVAAVEMDYVEDHARVNSIRSVYERKVISEDGTNIIQKKLIDNEKLLYIDDKRADEWSATTGVRFPLRAFSNLNPSAANIGENGKNVNRDFLTKSDIIGENADAIYFQVEKEFFDEVQGETEEETKENIEKIIVGLDSEHAVNLFYTSEEERALADKAYRDAISPELEKALQKDIKDEKVKNETFLKMMENREAVKAFLKQTAQAEKRGLYGEFLKETGGGFITLAHRIAEGKPLTDKQTGILNKYITADVAAYRNLFAELNGFTALRSLTESEKAFTEAFARAKAEGGTEKVKPKTRAEIQDKMFLEEMADDEKFNAFLNEAASAYFFDFKNFKAQDAEDAAYRNEIMRKNERVNREMRNFSWKAAFAKIHHGKEVSAKTLSNIKGQIRNAPRSYRSLYADLMGRDDMRVRDAESTDAIIKTKLKSRPSARFKAEELKLENMSPSEKQRIIKALDNEEMERRVLNGTITVDDAEKMREAARLKNAEIKVLEKKIKSLEEKFESEKAIDGTVIEDLKKKLRFEKLTRKVLRDVAKANEAACKGVMRRINIKECSAEIAEGLAAAQWFLRGKVQKALRATHAEVEERIREGYALWKTSEAYRQKLTAMSSHKRNWKAVLNLLDGKDFDEWTAEDKKLARSVIPMRNKFFSLGLDKKTSRNFEEMRTADLTAEQKEEEALKILPSHIFAKLKNEPLSRWTVDELLELNAVINEKYAEGKKKYAAVQAEKRYADAQIRESVIKTLLKTKGYKETAAAWSEDEKEKKRGLTSLLRSGKYTAMRPYAFMEMLDGGRQGVMYDVFEYEKRECGNRLKQGVEAQINEFTGLLNSLGVDVSYFEEKTVFKDFYIKKEKGDLTGQDKNDLTLKKGEILGVYLASFDEKSLMAVQYGNFAEQQERDMARQTGSTGALDSFSEARLKRVLKEAERLMAEDEAFKAAAEFMQAHYKKEGARLKEHNRRVNNEITEIRDYYFPMLRLDGSGEEDPRITRKKIVGEYSTGTRQGVEKGQTKSRIDIGAANQTAIDVNAVSAFFKSVEANQKLYAFDEYAQKLNRLVKGYDSKNFRRILENARGREAVSYLDKQVNAIINPSSGRVFSDTDKVLRSLRGAAAPAYLGWKLSGIIKQGLTSPAPFMQYLNPLEYAKAALDLAFNRKENLDFIYSRSTLMKNRSFDIMKDLTDALAKEAKTKAGKALTRFQQAGMKGLEMIDAVCVAPGWLASYRKEEARLLKENKTAASPLSGMQIDLAAARFADDVLVRTQPSGEVSDLAPLFREGGEALKLLLQFQSSLNVIYNNIRHDLPNAVRQKQYKRAAGIAAGYALAGIAVGAVCEGFGGEDEEEADKVRRAVFYAFTQGTDSVPIVSSMVTGLTEKAITGKTGYRGSSNIFAAFEKFAQGSASLRDADFKKAAVRYGESAGLVLGLPTSGAKEAYRAAEQVFNGELPSALWGRR